MDKLFGRDIRRDLAYYQQLMMTAKTEGDMRLHESCVRITRELSKQIKEKSSLLVTDCTNSNSIYPSLILTECRTEVNHEAVQHPY